MEIIGFTIVALALYVAADAILVAIEKKLGRTLESRSIVFFVIITVLAVITFNLIQYFTVPSSTPEMQQQENREFQNPALPANLPPNKALPDNDLPTVTE